MELPYLFTYSRTQRLAPAFWTAVFLVLTAVSLGFHFTFGSVWLQIGALVGFLIALVFWNQYRIRLARFVVDETSLVYSEPGWKFWLGPARALVFPYSDSTLHIRWSRKRSNPIPDCAVVSGPNQIVLPGTVPEFQRLVDHLRTHIAEVDEERVPRRGQAVEPLESGVVLRYGRLEKGWVLFALAVVVAVLVFPGLGADESWLSLLLDSTVQVVGVSLIVSLLWIVGPKLWVDNDGITYRFLRWERRIQFENLERVEFRNGIVWEQMTLRGEDASIAVYHPLGRYEELVDYIEGKRPDCVVSPEITLPWIIRYYAINPWLQGGLVALWSVLVGVTVYFVIGRSEVWPLDMLQVVEFLAGMTPALLALGLYWLLRIRQIEFRNERIVLARKWRNKVYAVHDLLRIEYELKLMEHQRLTFHLRENEFQVNASQIKLPLRSIQRTLNDLYPWTRQADVSEINDREAEMETAGAG